MTDSIRLTIEQFTAVILSMPSGSDSIISFRDGDMADASDVNAWLHYVHSRLIGEGELYIIESNRHIGRHESGWQPYE